MKHYTCKVPYMPELGSVSPFVVTESSQETKEEYAVWYLNTMRDHDGLPHRNSLPTGTTFMSLTDKPLPKYHNENMAKLKNETIIIQLLK